MAKVIAVRGATTVGYNTEVDIIYETKALLDTIIKENQIQLDNIISIFFTATKDLDAVYPAVAARNLGIMDSALLCLNEMNVMESLPMCIRILMHIESDKQQKEINHVYLKGAKLLRPDLLKE